MPELPVALPSNRMAKKAASREERLAKAEERRRLLDSQCMPYRPPVPAVDPFGVDEPTEEVIVSEAVTPATVPGMTILRVMVHVTRKRSVNYNSTEYSAGLEADVEPGDQAQVDAAQQALIDQCRATIVRQFQTGG
jgi:hypothetical protein